MKRHSTFAFTIALGIMLSGCGTNGGEAAHSPTAAKPPRPDLLRIPEELRGHRTSSSQATVDIVNEQGPVKVTDQERVFRARSESPLWIRGWAYDEPHKATPNRVWIELAGRETSHRFFIPADRMERPDVATGFKLPWARMAGFATPEIRDHNLPAGTYDVKVYQIAGEQVVLTKYYAVPQVTLVVE